MRSTCAIEAVRHRDAIYDAGDAADRRLYRQCRRAVEGARHRRLRAVPGRVPRRGAAKAASSPMRRDEKLARPWVKPGTPGLLHRIGGIEKQLDTGNIDYAPANHQAMTDIRRDKVARHRSVPDQDGRAGRGRRQAGGRRLGLDLRPDPPGGAARARARGSTSAISTSATSGRCRAIWAICSRVTTRSSCPK